MSGRLDVVLKLTQGEALALFGAIQDGIYACHQRRHNPGEFTTEAEQLRLVGILRDIEKRLEDERAKAARSTCK